MFDDTNEILLEQYISCSNMSHDTRDLCVNLIRKIKEIECSEFLVHKNDNRKFNIVKLSLNNKDGKTITFNGFTMNEIEVRYLRGQIHRKNNIYYVATNFYRANEYIDEDDENCDLSTFDIFTINKDKVIRKTLYKNTSKVFEVELEPFDEDELYGFYYDMINPNQKKLKNTIN